ncbi:GNAT family N-acetyltransferase [Sphingobacterium kitahiroshimense]|uniref:GNAT family N-acetyltransferase n=1 Tax=Sphingobacterium kitahiroshimense TaxID=470446 RepID=UPI00320A4B5E
MIIEIRKDRILPKEQLILLYDENSWSSAKKPEELYNGLINSHSLLTAWDNDKLVGLGNAISDGFLVVYYPHLIVLPDYQGKGVGRLIMDEMRKIYEDIHMQMLVADKDSLEFYKKVGFSKAGETTPMWIYSGNDH